ncbi:cell division protein ZapA [Alphaproteobacteria bacterium]|nr:cell division protein ZapA [Alphaproteobacteria bacterium]MDC1241019.1 cell division protein ZapA [bacterium]
MAEMTITVNDRAFQIMCRDGEEPQVSKLAADLAGRVEEISKAMGPSNLVGDSHLLVLTSLTLLSEMRDLQEAIESLKNDTGNLGQASESLTSRVDEMEATVVAALTEAAEKVEAMMAPNDNRDLPSGE